MHFFLSSSIPQLVTEKKERRKVQVLLMDQPGRNGTGKSPQAGRAVSSNQGRPMSTDDIQKAKMRAMFMQSKYGKNETSSADKLPISHSNRILSAHNIHVTPKIKIHKRIREDKKPERMVSEITPSKAPMDSEPSSSTKEQTLWEKVNKERIPWNNPPEFIINSEWSVGAGEKSKEVEIQTGRLQREKEIVYQRIQDVPSNPNAPWDLELDYDDSLTPEIPTQQAPDIESADTYASPQNIENDSYVSLPAPTSTENVPGPDLQLLAVLLKNPELVFALTSGQGSNLNSAETVKLLDMIKNSGNGLTGTLNGFEGETKMVEATVTTSLPSPTPSSEPIMVCNFNLSPWRKEPATRDSFPQQVIAMPTLPSSNGFSQPQIPNASNIASQSPQVTINQTPQHPVYNQTPPNHVIIQSPSVTVHQYRPQNNMGVGYASQPQSQHHQETLTNYGQMQNIKPAPLSIVLNTLPLPPMLQTPVYQEPQLLQQPWSGPNHNNYVVFPGNHQPQYTNMYPSNGYVGEHDAEGWSPERSPDYHDQSSFGRNYTDNRRDVGRNRSRRRDRGGNNRRWRDRRN
ncbi:hypothetical protein GIB67_015163 [Kingdonia uniflora]|uniref:Uncharacterized protein n=1 Tax=Kingdonia uniflora TaxID=39325 RepID=A0A7J7LJ64_9MAGN|nr:hypothetical protein GIB67_015163 [Kingdonia uniflora]